MASMKLLVIVAFVASVFCGVQCQEETPSGSKAVDMVTQPQGVRVVFPFFSPKLKTINANLKKHFDEDVHETFNYLRNSVVKLVSNRKVLISDDKMTFATTLFEMAKKQKSRRERLQKSIKISEEFNAANKVMFRQLLRMIDIKYQTIRNEPKDYKKLAEDLNNYLATLEQALKSSPVGVYVNFEQGKIGDSSFMEVTSEIMARLEYHGTSIYWCIDKFLDV